MHFSFWVAVGVPRLRKMIMGLLGSGLGGCRTLQGDQHFLELSNCVRSIHVPYIDLPTDANVDLHKAFLVYGSEVWDVARVVTASAYPKEICGRI